MSKPEAKAKTVFSSSDTTATADDDWDTEDICHNITEKTQRQGVPGTDTDAAAAKRLTSQQMSHLYKDAREEHDSRSKEIFKSTNQYVYGPAKDGDE